MGRRRRRERTESMGDSGRGGFRGDAGYSSDGVCKRVGLAGIDLVFRSIRRSGTAAQPKSREVKTGFG